MPPSDESKEDVDARAAAIFELRDLHAPRISGRAAWLITNVLESPIMGAPLRAMIARNSGFNAYRARASSARACDAAVAPRNLPLHYPQPPPAAPAELAQLDALFLALAAAAPSPDEAPADAAPARPTIRDYHRAFRAGTATPTQVAEALLRLIRASHDHLNAVVCTQEDDVRAHAAASTERWARNEPLSVLDGVPYTVKTSIDVAGYPTRCSSGFLLDEDEARVEEDADVVRACRQAGMIMIAKANMDELGSGVRGYSSSTGQTRNPHNIDHVPGGSSGGGATLVAAGLCPVSLGSDSAGSIRIPSACCGVFGLKPTFGRVSAHGRVLTKRDENVDEVSPLLHNGPIAGCAEDLIIMYYLLAGAAPHRPIPTEPEFSPTYEVIPENVVCRMDGLRIGVCLPWVQSGSNLGYSTMRLVLDAMFAQGAEEVPIVIPDLEDQRVALSVSVMNEFLKHLKEQGYYGEGSQVRLGYDTRMKLKMGEQFTDQDLARSKIVRTKGMEYCVKELFDKNRLDLLVTPAIGTETPQVPHNLVTGMSDAYTDSRMMKFANYSSFLGLPSCFIPVEKDDSTGLPRAIQFIAAPWREDKLLEVCLWAEKEFKTRSIVPTKHCFNALDSIDNAS